VATHSATGLLPAGESLSTMREAAEYARPMSERTVDDVELAASVLSACDTILLFTGAGISTESGIPDFRGPNGLWTKVDPALYTIQNYLADGDFRATRWRQRFSEALQRHEPNPAHRAVAKLWRAGRMIGCITQNVDGLHQAAGLPDDAVAELHGNAGGYVCWDGGHRATTESLRARWEDGEADPSCSECGSIMKPTVVMFGETLPETAMERAQRWTDVADAVIVVGSTLGVYPAALFPLEVASRGDPVVIVNQGETDHEGIATVRIHGMAGVALPAIVDRVVGS
jgi:NAD-dependent protein deacetylase/lipoamidase